MPASGQRRAVAEGLLSAVVLQGFLLVTGVIAARVLGPTDRGLLALIWVAALILTQFGGLGVPLAVTYELAQGGIAMRTLTRVLRKVALCQVVGLTVALGASLALLAEWRALPHGPALVALVVVPAMLIHNYCVAAFQGTGAFRSLHVYRLMPTALYAVVLTTGVIAGADSLLFVTTAWVGSYAFSAIIALIAARRLAHRQDPSADKRTTTPRALIRFGSSGLIGYASPTESFRFDQLMVGLLLSVSDLGLYVAALAFCNLPRFLAQALGLISYPMIAAATSLTTQRRLLWTYTAIGTATAASVVVPLMLFARPLLELAFGADFAPAALTTQILLAGTVAVCARRLIADGLRGAGAPGAGSKAEALSWLWLAPALAILVPLAGLVGVAIAVASSYVAATVFLLRAAEHRGLGLRQRPPNSTIEPVA